MELTNCVRKRHGQPKELSDLDRLPDETIEWLASCVVDDEHRLPALYAEVRSVLRPGGVFINADHMPDPGLPGLSEQLAVWDSERRAADYAGDLSSSWEGWWQRVEQDPALAPLVAQRRQFFDGWHAAEFVPTHDWHLEQLRSAGFGQVGLVWRGLRDAAVAAVR